MYHVGGGNVIKNSVTNAQVNQITRKIKGAISKFSQKITKQVRVVNLQIKGSRVWSGPSVVLSV